MANLAIILFANAVESHTCR